MEAFVVEFYCQWLELLGAKISLVTIEYWDFSQHYENS